RYGYEWVHADDRVRAPLVRKGGDLIETSWPEALDAAADGLRKALDVHGSEGVAVLGGGRGTNEDAYAWVRFAKGVIGTDHVDAQLGDGLPADVVLGVPRATIADCDRAAAIVLLAPDLKEELPILFLRVREAAEELGVPLIDVAACDHGLTRYADAAVRYVPGEEHEVVASLVRAFDGDRTGDEQIDRAGAALEGRDGDVVVILGRPSMAEASDSVVRAAAVLAGRPGTRFLSALRRSNVHGALDLGLAPGFLPGRVTLDAGRERFADAWGQVPGRRGLDAAGILQAAADGQLHGLVLLDADPIADFPDRRLARDALANVDFVVACDAFLTESTRGANVFLPVTVWAEKPGTASNIEGRVQRLSQQVSPEGTVMSDWRIAVELAARFDADFDLETVPEVLDEIARVAPAFAGVDTRLLGRARDGIVLPLGDHHDELVLDAGGVPLTDASWEPIRPGTIASDEALTSHVGTGVVESTGTGSTTTVKPGLTEVEPPAASHEEAEALGRTAREAVAAGPPLHEWDRETGRAPAQPRDAYALRLVSGRKLYDAGRVSAASPSLAPLAEGATLLVHSSDRDRIGIADGDTVQATSGRGSVVLPVRAAPGIPRGIAFLTFNQPGPGAGDLIDAGAAVTDVRLETVGSAS
ncbi:MAG TPA: molybdopterin-dependent oxidoreductase, partial [Acidimicrobiia bacterium]|nr:molybdopterin-dependent oxidoreductase [Acidimicrobiia bacterium]